jgi:hypothetical protein
MSCCDGFPACEDCQARIDEATNPPTTDYPYDF